MKKPSLGIIITVYNKEQYLEKSINSLLQQTSLPDELIIINDCSTDGSNKIIEGMIPKISSIIPKYKYFNLKKNTGAAEARNRCLAEIGTDFILFLDSDDSYETNYIASIRGLLTDSTGMVCSAVKMEKSGYIYPSKLISKYTSNDSTGSFISHPLKFLGHESLFIGGGNVCFSRKIMGNERFDPHEHNMEEWDFYYRILKRTQSNNCKIYYNNSSCYIYNDYDESSLSRYMLDWKDIKVPRIINNLNHVYEKKYRGLLISIWGLNSVTRCKNIYSKIRFLIHNRKILYHSNVNRYFFGMITNCILPQIIFNYLKKIKKQMIYN